MEIKQTLDCNSGLKTITTEKRCEVTTGTLLEDNVKKKMRDEQR